MQQGWNAPPKTFRRWRFDAQRKRKLLHSIIPPVEARPAEAPAVENGRSAWAPATTSGTSMTVGRRGAGGYDSKKKMFFSAWVFFACAIESELRNTKSVWPNIYQKFLGTLHMSANVCDYRLEIDSSFKKS